MITINKLVCPDCGGDVVPTDVEGKVYLCVEGHFTLLEKLISIPVKEASDANPFRS